MDEPTDALTDTETESLFNVMKELRKQGKSMVYISHRLEEIFEICDDVTILRDGKFIAEEKIENLTKDKMIELMVGRKLEEQFPKVIHKSGDVTFEAKNLTNKYLENVSFDIKAGEILGISGLMGAGRTELAKSIYGAYPLDQGEIYLNGEGVIVNNPKDAIKSKIAYVSEDRKKDGLILNLSVMKNIHISALDTIKKRFGYLDTKKEALEAGRYIDSMSIKTPSIHQKTRNLSGGNQQKVALGRCLAVNPDVFILMEPTQGIDVGVKFEIYQFISEQAAAGKAILLISSEVAEIQGLAHRILVMHDGKIVAELEAAETDQEEILRYALGEKT